MSRRSRHAGEGAETITETVWDLGTRMLNNSNDTIQNLPDMCSKQEAEEYIGLCALLETKSPAVKKGKNTGKYFTKATHMFTRVESWNPKEGFKLLPINSYGEVDGVAMPESPSNVFVLPAVDRVIDFGGKCGARSVQAYVNDTIVLKKTETPKKKPPQKKKLFGTKFA